MQLLYGGFVHCVPDIHGNAADGDKGRGVLFNVICDHNKEILHVQPFVLASNNDKISIKYNEFLKYHGIH